MRDTCFIVSLVPSEPGEAAVVEEELEQGQVIVAQVPAEEEVPPQPTVQVLGQRTRPDRPPAEGLEFFGERVIVPAEALPEGRVWGPSAGALDGQVDDGEEFPDHRR